MERKWRRREDPGSSHAPDWIVTYTDMISLLVTFFVLLMTFSSLETYDTVKIASFLDANRGLRESSKNSSTPPPRDDRLAASSIIRGARSPHTRPPHILPDDLEEMGRKWTEEHKELDFTALADGLLIEFAAEAGFAPGGLAVSDELRDMLIEVARVLENYPHMVVVEGCTDDTFQPTPDHPTAAALSLARAKAAADAMLAGSELNPALVQVAGLGTAHPRSDDVSPGGRRANRRVRLRVLSLSKARLVHVEATADREGAR